MSVCRWGILSTAEIGQKNWKAILHADSATLTAVASRDRKKASAFIEQLQVAAPFEVTPVALGSYDALVAAADVDAVYLPIPTGLRVDWAVRCAEAGKHILIEKPAAVSSAELQRVIDACSANHVQLMDGVMFMHSARLAALRATIDNGQTIGALRRITTSLSFCGDERFFQSNIRASAELEPLGCLGDLGWYCVRFALWVMSWQMPRHVSGRLLKQTDAGVPIEFAGELLFGDVSAGIYCSFVTDAQQWVSISGSRGHIRVDDFVLPFADRNPSFVTLKETYHINNCDFVMRANDGKRTVNEDATGTRNSQEAIMIETFSRLVLGGQPDTKWADYAAKTQRAVDAALQSARAGAELVSL